MRSTVLTALLLVAGGTISHAQFTILPQVGFEQSRTSINYNAISASRVEGNLAASLKMDYSFKSGHGAYISLGTSPAPMSFAFDNAGELMKNYEAAKGNL